MFTTASDTHISIKQISSPDIDYVTVKSAILTNTTKMSHNSHLREDGISPVRMYFCLPLLCHALLRVAH